MPSDKPARRLEDIIENAQAIQRYIAGMDLAAFEKDRRTCDAVERCMEPISEAAAKLGDLAPVIRPDPALLGDAIHIYAFRSVAAQPQADQVTASLRIYRCCDANMLTLGAVYQERE